jgi:hypothetical protein
MGCLDLAQEEAGDNGLTGTIPHAVSVAQCNSKRLLRLVSDLLATASGSVSVEPRPVPVAELISTCLRAAAPRPPPPEWSWSLAAHPLWRCRRTRCGWPRCWTTCSPTPSNTRPTEALDRERQGR